MTGIVDAFRRRDPGNAGDRQPAETPGPRYPHLWAWYLGGTGLLTLLYLFVPPVAGNGPLINLLGLSSPIAIAAGILIHRPRQRAAWWFFALGQLLFVSGDVYTYSYRTVFGAEVPFPSIGDGLYLAVYPALMTGLIILVRTRNPRRDRPALIDSLILTIGAGLLSWVFLIQPNVHLSGLSWFAKSVSVAYPVGDLLLLAAAIRLAVDAGRRAPAFYLLVGSIVGLFATDSAYAYALLRNGYHHQLIFDVGWILYYLLWGAAALHPSMRTLEEPSLKRTRLTRTRLALLGGACMIAPGVRFSQELGNADVLVVIAASALLFLFVVTRMAGLVRQEERTTSRERALRTAGTQLVAAVGREQVQEAAIAAVGTVLKTEGSTHHLVLLERGDSASVVASTHPAASWPLGTATSGWLQLASEPARQVPLSSLPGHVRSELRLVGGDSVLVVPLPVRTRALGFLIVCSPVALAPELLDSLQALATKVALAVDGTLLAEDLHRRKSAARFRSLVAHSTDLITVLDAEGTVTYQSPSIERVLGYRADEIEGTRYEDLLAATDRGRLAQVVETGGRGTAEMHSLECSIRHRDGTWLLFEVRYTDLLHDEDVRGVVLNSRDISERKAFEEQLAHQAFHDPVTNLANRALFADRVQHALKRGERTGARIAVMFIDLDDFKTVNDSLGHPAGDRVLKEVAQRLVSAVRPTDTVARFGGDEFAVLIDTVNETEESVAAAERILRSLELQLTVEGKQVFPRASIGICLAEPSTDALAAEDLLRNADVAMYIAKRDNKGRFRMFEPAMHDRALERLELGSDLQRAIDLEELQVHYQPVVRLDRREFYGVEALLRWMHPTRGTVHPEQFIPLAEETGLIIPIGRWVLRTACRDGALLQRRLQSEEFVMSVNLSVRQLQSETIVADVREALEASGLPPRSLVLEITESVMLADTDLAVRRLQDLKELGIRLAMDDFGTGYSSLSYLGRLPVDILKMDRSFLASRENDSLTAAIIALGSNLTLEVVAEGIERTDQATSLHDLGCELGQGFLFGKAMSSEDLLEFVTRSRREWAPFALQPESDAA